MHMLHLVIPVASRSSTDIVVPSARTILVRLLTLTWKIADLPPTYSIEGQSLVAKPSDLSDAASSVNKDSQ